MRQAMSIIRGNWRFAAGLALAGMVSATVSTLVLPLMIRRIVDAGIINHDFGSLLASSGTALVVVLMSSVANYLLGLGRSRLLNRVVRAKNLEMLDAFYSRPYGDVLRRDRGYFIARIYDETVRASAPLVSFFTVTTVAIVAVGVALGVLVSLSWRLTVMVSFVAPLLYLVTSRLSGKIRETSRLASEEEAQTKGVLERLIRAYPVVNVFALLQTARRHFDRSLGRQLDATYANAKNSEGFAMASGFLAFATQILLLSLSGYEIIQGRLTLGGAMAVSNIYGMLVSNATSVLRSLPAFQQGLATVERLNEFGKSPNTRPAAGVAGGISIRQAEFAYGEGGSRIYRDFNLEIKPGEKVLIVGSNGTGKTTLLRLISGFLEPDTGLCLTPPPERLSLSLFPPAFVPGDVLENVGYERLDQSSKEFFQALMRQFGCVDKIGEDPEDLSSGQKQKISIAMALLKDADLYLFDEPLANVDLRTQAVILERIFERSAKRTLVVAMHCDEGLARLFDRVIDLDRRHSADPADLRLALA